MFEKRIIFAVREDGKRVFSINTGKNNQKPTHKTGCVFKKINIAFIMIRNTSCAQSDVAVLTTMHCLSKNPNN
jgi:hypothetical protein